MRDIISESIDRRSLPSASSLTELAGPREGAEARPREIDRGAVVNIGVRMGRVRCLACGAPLGPEMQHV